MPHGYHDEKTHKDLLEGKGQQQGLRAMLPDLDEVEPRQPARRGARRQGGLGQVRGGGRGRGAMANEHGVLDDTDSDHGSDVYGSEQLENDLEYVIATVALGDGDETERPSGPNAADVLVPGPVPV